MNTKIVPSVSLNEAAFSEPSTQTWLTVLSPRKIIIFENHAGILWRSESQSDVVHLKTDRGMVSGGASFWAHRPRNLEH